MKLDVTFFAQRVGLFNAPPVDDPDGCWYASAKMIGTYHEGNYFRSRKGVPELNNADGTHQALGTLPDGRDGFGVLLKNENMETLSMPPDFGLDTLAVALEKRGPILFFWWSTNYATGIAYYHASVLIGVMNEGAFREVIYHDPAVGPDKTMSFATLQSLRSSGIGPRQPFAVRKGSTIPAKKVNVIAGVKGDDTVRKKAGS